MSTTTIQAEASKPQINKMQECRRCKDAGFPNQLIGFEKIGEDPTTGKVRWKLVNEDGQQHEHKSNNQQQKYDKEYKTSYPATIANIPRYILVKREREQ
jgi:hypothetical protein